MSDRLPDCDLANAYPGLAAIRQAALASDWPKVRAYYNALPTGSDRTLVSAVTAEDPGVGEALQAQLEEQGDEPLALALLGTYEVAAGWRGLGGGWKVPGVHGPGDEEGFAAFQRRLRRAEVFLLHATALDPGCDIAWAGLLRTARGRRLGADEVRRRYDRLADHNPAHYSAQSRMMQQLTPKWGGSWEAAHAFAEACARQTPAGSLSRALVAEVHIEHWVAGETGHLRRADVRQALAEAADSSVLHPDCRPVYPWVRAHGAFALAFSLGDDPKQAAPHFRALADKMYAKPPWGYLTDPAGSYARFRDVALEL